jgi:hypothetical protein
MTTKRMNAQQIVRLVEGAEIMAEVTGVSVSIIVAGSLGVEIEEADDYEADGVAGSAQTAAEP